MLSVRKDKTHNLPKSKVKNKKNNLLSHVSASVAPCSAAKDTGVCKDKTCAQGLLNCVIKRGILSSSLQVSAKAQMSKILISLFIFFVALFSTMTC